MSRTPLQTEPKPPRDLEAAALWRAAKAGMAGSAEGTGQPLAAPDLMTLAAYLDNRLSPAERAEVERALIHWPDALDDVLALGVADDPAHRIGQLRGQIGGQMGGRLLNLAGWMMTGFALVFVSLYGYSTGSAVTGVPGAGLGIGLAQTQTIEEGADPSLSLQDLLDPWMMESDGNGSA